MLKQSVLIISLLFGRGLALSPPARADDARLIATHNKWSVYAVDEKGGKVCYMLSKPDKAEGKYTRREEIYALITDRPADSSKNVFSYIAGYPYKPGSDATISIDDQKFTLFTQDDTAWAPDAATDEKIAQAMAKGSDMVVRGTSARGTATVDTYSLEGSGAAHKAMAQECDANNSIIKNKSRPVMALPGPRIPSDNL